MAKTGVFLGIPYDWRWPTPAVLRERLWNPYDRRIFTPKVFGWGWSINFYQVFHRLDRLARR
jgi:poly(A) polymerase Pap1